MTMLDGNSAAELAHDKGEMPTALLAQARKELKERAWRELTFDTVLNALEEISKSHQLSLVVSIKRGSTTLMSMTSAAVEIYTRPSDEEVMQRAAEIEAENNFTKGADV